MLIYSGDALTTYDIGSRSVMDRTTSAAVRIALFSDLHLGLRHWPPPSSSGLLDYLVDHISGNQPHIVICTGDLLDSPLSPLAWSQAQRLLNRLQEKCGDQCPVQWIPGDHDLAIRGKIAIKQFVHAILRRRFSSYRLEDDCLARPDLGLTLLGVATIPSLWQSLSRWWSGTGPHPDHGVPNEALDPLAGAKTEQGSKHENLVPQTLRIAAMHHIPLHILPGDGSTTRLTPDRAGLLLATLAEDGTHLLLHGDAHRPAHYRLTICLNGLEREIITLCPGRIKPEKPWKNTYMLISVGSTGEISVQLYRMVGGQTFEPADRYEFTSPL
jgi:hypothetical protein